MIRKWLKFNASFVEILKNSATSKDSDFKWLPEYSSRYQSRGSHGSLIVTTAAAAAAANIATTSGSFAGTSPPAAVNPMNRPIKFWLGDPWERGDTIEFSDSDESESAVVESPAKTDLFKISGPKGSAFLVEVSTADMDEVRDQLNNLRGDNFHFDKNVLKNFKIKCLLTAEPLENVKPKDRSRLARIHAIASGSEKVEELNENGQLLFVNSVERRLRAKTILEKFRYKISETLYRFQPTEKVRVDDKVMEICRDFIEAVQCLPQVLSVTHNL